MVHKRQFSILALVMLVILIAMPSVSAWWNDGYAVRYELNFTNTQNINRTDEPIKLNVASVLCQAPNRNDLRIVFNDVTEIPVQILSDNVTAVFVANISALTTNVRWGYIYCGNATATKPVYDTGFKAYLINTNEFKIEPGMLKASYYYVGGAAKVWNMTGGINFTADASDSGLGLYKASTSRIFDVAQAATCSLNENGTVYAKIICNSSTGYSMIWEYYTQNLLYRWSSRIDLGNPVGFRSNLGTTAADSRVYNTPISATTWANYTGATVTLYSFKGILSIISNSRTYGITYIYNSSYAYQGGSQNATTGYMRASSTNDPIGCVGDTDFNCGGPAFNLTRVAGTSGNLWMGYSKSDEITLNNSFNAKMNPVASTLGASENPVPPVIPAVLTSVYIVPVLRSFIYDTNPLECYATATGNKSALNFNYRWFNNSVFYSAGNKTGLNNTATLVSNLSSSISAMNENWTCVVVATENNVTFSSYLNASKFIEGMRFNSSIPANINFGNLFDDYLNTSYDFFRVSSVISNPMNFQLWHTTNSSYSPYAVCINGTCYAGWESEPSYYNTTSWVEFELSESEIYPGIYNMPQTLIQTIPHNVSVSITGANNDLSVEFLNFSTNTQYNILEFMMNATSGSNLMRIYYCNSTYNFDEKVQNSNYCAEIGSQLASTPYNHSHSQYSSHMLITVPLNATSGLVNGVKATSKSYFIFRGGLATTWTMYGVTNIVRDGIAKKSTTHGLSWTNQTFTPDTHIHQFYNDSIYYEYACFNESEDSNRPVCSSIRSDALDVNTLPPTSPIVNTPIEGSVLGATVQIDWTASQSAVPGVFIDRYVGYITYASNGSIKRQLFNVSNTTLTYSECGFNLTDGNYSIRVVAHDTSGGSATGSSPTFLINTTIKTIIDPASTANNSYVKDLAYYCHINAAPDVLSNLKVSRRKYDCTGSTTLTTYAYLDANGNYSGTASYTCDAAQNYYVCDPVGFWATESCSFNYENAGNVNYYVNGAPPVVAIQSPTATVYPTLTVPYNISLNYTASDMYRDVCSYSLDGSAYTNIASCANLTLPITAFGRHYVNVTVNDSGALRTNASVSFVIGYINLTLISPSDGLITNSNSMDFSCSAQPSSGNLTEMNFYLYQDSIIDNQKVSLNTNSKYIFNVTSTAMSSLAGNFTWWCSANSSDLYVITSSTRTFYNDLISPVISIQQPVNNSVYLFGLNSSVAINYTASDNYIIDYCKESTMPSTGINTLSTCQNTSLNMSLFQTAGFGQFVINMTIVDKAGNTHSDFRNIAAVYIADNLSSISVVNSNFTFALTGYDFGNLGNTGTSCTAISNDSSLSCESKNLTGFTVNIFCNVTMNVEKNIALRTRCTNAGYVFDSSTANFILDSKNPILVSKTFGNGKPVRVGYNVSGSFVFSDSNLWRVNSSIDGVSIFSVQDINSTTYTYNLSYNTSGYTIGAHSLQIDVWDSHTAAEIDEYIVSKTALSNKLKYNTDSNVITITATDESSAKLVNPFTTQKLHDRYTFDYKPSQELDSYVFTVDTKEELFIVNKPDSDEKIWIVSGNNWIDFYTPKRSDIVVSIIKLTANKAQVTISSDGSSSDNSKEVPIIITPIKGEELIEKEDFISPETPVKLTDEIGLISFSSVGDLNLLQLNYTFTVYNVSVTYAAAVSETQEQTINAYVDFGSVTNLQSYATITYKNDSLNKTCFAAGTNNCTYTFITPNVDNNIVLPINVSLYTIYPALCGGILGTCTNTTEVLTFSQTVLNSGLVDCSTPNSTVAITFFGIDEKTGNSTIYDLNINLELWISNPNLTLGMHYGFTGETNYSLCVIPNSTQYQSYGIMEYFAVGYENRKYYIFNNTISGLAPQNVYLNLINSTGASYVLMEVDNQDNGKPIEGAYIKMLRYYPETDSYQQVEIERTDNNGKTGMWAYLADVFYKFIVEYPNGEVRLITDRQKLLSDTKVFLISLADNGLDNWATIGMTDTNTVCDESITTCSFVWTDSTNSVQTANFKVYQDTGFSKILLYEQTVSSPSGVLFYQFNATNNTRYVAQSTLTVGDTTLSAGEADLYIRDTPFSQDKQGLIGLLLPMILMIVAAAALLLDFGAVGVTIGVTVIMILGILTGLIPVSPVSIVVFILLAGILVFKLRG